MTNFKKVLTTKLLRNPLIWQALEQLQSLETGNIGIIGRRLQEASLGQILGGITVSTFNPSVRARLLREVFVSLRYWYDNPTYKSTVESRPVEG